MHFYRTWELCFSDFFLGQQIPEVHFTLRDIAKATNHENLAERTDFDCISELLAEFKSRFSIQIIHCDHCWLLTCNNNELLAILCPLDILDLIVKDRNELSILALVDPNILQRVLSVITFAS